MGRATFTRIYRAHFHGVLRAVRLYGVPDRDGPDVAQDVFVRVHASLSRLEVSRPLKPWLQTIAYRTARDYQRSAVVRRTELAGEDTEQVDPTPTPEARAMLTEGHRVFVEIVQEMNEDQRTVFLMNVVDEIPITEIAEALGEAEGTVRSRLFRAHQVFEQSIEKRRQLEERRNYSVMPVLFAGTLVKAAQKGLEADPATKALVWGRLVRLLGVGLLGPLASLSGGAVVAFSGALVAAGVALGAAGHAVVVGRERPEEPIVEARAEAPPPPAAAAAASGPESATTATATATATAAPPSASSATTEADAGAVDPTAAFRAEGAILSRAKAAMDREDWQTALRELRRHERTFPRGTMASQRQELMSVVMGELKARDGGTR